MILCVAFHAWAGTPGVGMLPRGAVFGLMACRERNEKPAPSSRRRAVRDVLYGLCGGVLIAVLKLTEYRFLVVEHSVEI